MKGDSRDSRTQGVGFPIQGIVLVIFAIFCEKDSSSFHGVRREGPSAQKPPKTGNTKKHFAQKIAKITKGETPAFPARIHYASDRGRKQLFRDISKRRHLMHFDVKKQRRQRLEASLTRVPGKA